MRIHFISNSLRMNSGFSNVTRYIAIGLRKLGYDVSITGLQTAYLPEYSFGIECLPIDTVFVDETTQVMLNIQKTNPDIVFCIHQADADMNHLFKLFPKTALYCPVEGKNIHDGMANDLRSIEKNGGIVIAQCRYGQSEMKKVGVGAKCVYHGYNDNIFRPLDLKDKNIKYCYYTTEVGQASTDPFILHQQGCYDCDRGDKKDCPHYKEEIVNILRWESENKRWIQRDIGIDKLEDELKGREKRFIYLGVFQNFGLRKQIPRLLNAYAILIGESKQLKDRTYLHLHSLPISIKGVNIIKVINDLGIADNVSFSYGTFRSSGWSEEGIARLYNTADCQVTATSSEGFMLPVVEGFACGLPIVAPNCSSLTELIGNSDKIENNRGWLANIATYHQIQDGSSRALVDERDLALKMKMAYVEKDKMKIFRENAMKWVRQYNWENIVKQWDKLLQEMK